MPAPKLTEFCDEVMELTRQPEFPIIQRRAARRRLRRRARLTAAVAGALVVAVGLTGAWPTGGQSAPPVATPPDRLAPRNPIHWADTADADHLYAVVADCNGCEARLVGSDDGGRTWTSRQATAYRKPAYAGYEFSDIELRGPSTMEQTGWIPKSGHPPVTIVSTDGGRSWASVTVDSRPVATVPHGGWLESVSTDDGMAAELRVTDPATRTVHPLATPPPGVYVPNVVQTPDGTGLWVQGRDSTGMKAMVAVSRDRGITWLTHTFDLTDPAFRVPTVSLNPSPSQLAQRFRPQLFATVDVVTRNGTTVYAVLGDGQHQWSVRSPDGGNNWTVLNSGDPLPRLLVADRPSFVRPDGTHVIQQQLDNDQFRAYVSADGGSRYVAIEAAGWPQAAVDLTLDGRYIARNWQTIYRSTDGQHWTTVTPR
jgi:photosystem II stability/assembly factor-like uncharacterized protein